MTSVQNEMTKENNIKIKATTEMAVQLYRNSEGEPKKATKCSLLNILVEESITTKPTGKGYNLFYRRTIEKE